MCHERPPRALDFVLRRSVAAAALSVCRMKRALPLVRTVQWRVLGMASVQRADCPWCICGRHVFAHVGSLPCCSGAALPLRVLAPTHKFPYHCAH